MPASYASKFKLHINLRTGEKARTELYLFSRKAREYSFFLKDFWGKDLMRVVIWNDSILVFYPQEMQFIKEPILPFSQSDYWIWSITPLELVQIIDGTLLKNMDEIHFLRENGELYQYKAKQSDMIYNFSLSPKDSGLRKVVISDENDAALAEVKWQGVRKYKNYVRPRRIEIRMKNTDDKIKLGVTEERFDLGLSERYFQLAIPNTARQIRIN